MAEERILVVDDEAHIVKMCIRALQAAGFEAEGVSNGTEAIERCQREAFDLLLLDLKMPGLGGLEVLRAVKELDPDIAVIIVTGYGTLESAVEAMRLGAQEYLNKPFDGDGLVAAVQQVLAKKLQASAVVRGNLREMSLTSIVSINCNERNQARLRIRRKGRDAVLFFEDGQIVHMALDSQEGKEVIYKLLTWEEGVFELEQDVPPPKRTVTTDWSSLILEGLRRIDEGAAGWEGLDALEEQEERKEIDKMATKKRGTILAEHLESLLTASADVNGAIIVGTDGLVLSSNMPMGGHDATRVGAGGAALLGLSKRTLDSLKCGDFEAAVLQGEDGWIITVSAGPRAMVLGLTNADVNLGMALLEMRDLAEGVAETMG